MEVEWSPQQLDALAKVKDWLDGIEQSRVSRLFSGDALLKPCFTVAGFAGTGKSTLAEHFAKHIDGQVHYAAYTGKAAYVLRQKGANEASTIHKLIYLPRDKCLARLHQLEASLRKAELRPDYHPEELKKLRDEVDKERVNVSKPEFTLNLDSPLTGAALAIIDEYSMVDERMGADLVSFGCPVLALGDPGQLPPVQGSRYFSGQPDVMLTEIHRHAEGNPIIHMSKEVREGKTLALGEYGESRVLMRADIPQDEWNRMLLDADQVLVGYNVTRQQLNRRIRKLLGRETVFPVKGDKLICLRNNHREGLLNGQIWTVVSCRQKRDLLDLHLASPDEGEDDVFCQAHRHYFEGKEKELLTADPRFRRSSNEFDYGYAMTVHKSQGSQWGSVLVLDEWNFEDRSRWLYTAITRAAQKVTIARKF